METTPCCSPGTFAHDAAITTPTNLSNHDEDPETAAQHRSTLVEAARAGAWTVAVSHFGSPFGRVVGDVGALDWSSVRARA